MYYLKNRILRMYQKSIYFHAYLLFFSSLFIGCERAAPIPADRTNNTRRIQIVCTTTMIEDLARNLAGGAADVIGIMRAGEDPHVYNVRPRDAEQIARADIILANGHHLESTLEKVIRNNATGPVVALAEKAVPNPLGGIADADRGAPDPHCWMSVSNFRGYLQHALDALIAVDPENADTYHKNARQYDTELQELDTWIQNQIKSIPTDKRIIVTSHDAFQYLAQAYGLDVRAMVGISTAEAPRPQEIEKIESLIRNRNVKAVFIETSTSSTLNTLVKKSAAATGATIGGTLYSDSLDEPGEPAGSYIGMMRHNVSAIASALGEQAASGQGATTP